VNLTVRQAANVLGVPETRVYRWIDDGDIPCTMVQHHPQFHRAELLEWAMENDHAISADLYEGRQELPLTTALERGGGHLLQRDLSEIADGMPIDEPADRELIRATIATRDAEMFARRGPKWIATPHVRSPIVCAGARPALGLWWCEHRAVMIDDAPTNALFVLIAPTIRQHLELLSRLSLVLQDRAFVLAIKESRAIGDVIAESRRMETLLARRSEARS